MSEPITKQSEDAGKTEEQLAREVFDPAVSDMDYFLSRKRYFERKGTLPTAAPTEGVL